MARVVRIDAINPIEGADQIEVAQIGGWKVVVKKGEYTAGSLAVYCEIDSFIPHSIAPFLTKPGQFPKVYNEVEGQRLRTIRLRGQISQGLLLSMSVRGSDGLVVGALFTEGDDVTDFLGIQKWEPPQEFRAANAKGSFPYFIPKTDQERIQNLSRSLEKWNAENHQWQVTEKIDGSSMTVFYKDGEVGVCSRNLELKDDGTSTFWETAKSEGLELERIDVNKDYMPENCKWATEQEQAWNQRIYKNNKSGCAGVIVRPCANGALKYEVRISKDGEEHYLGTYYSITEAVQVRIEAEITLYGKEFKDKRN
jgi:RNA ligase (TIGR02306 family)